MDLQLYNVLIKKKKNLEIVVFRINVLNSRQRVLNRILGDTNMLKCFVLTLICIKNSIKKKKSLEL